MDALGLADAGGKWALSLADPPRPSALARRLERIIEG
jgi:hypothetical protein